MTTPATATGTWSTPAMRSNSTPAGATSAAASPMPSPIACWTSRKASISRPSAACPPWWSRRSPATGGPYPYVDGLIMQVTQRIDSIEVRHIPQRRRPLELHLTRLVRLWLNLATSFSLAPLRLAIYAGLALSVLGAIGAVATISEALFVHHTPSGWASTMTVLLLVSGVQSMILGVLGEYVGRTFLSANGKAPGHRADYPAELRTRHDRLLGGSRHRHYHQHGRTDVVEGGRQRAGLRRAIVRSAHHPRPRPLRRVGACSISWRYAASRCRSPCPAPRSPTSPPR